MTRILVVDNYDSFVYTIVGYLRQMGAETVVVRNDAVADAGDVASYDGVLISPGPGTPAEAGSSMDVIRECAAAGIPMLGICLGHQALAEVFGGVVSHAPELMHGKTSLVTHEDASVMDGLPSPFTATRYHSLAVENPTVPDELAVTATTANGIIMGLQHRELPLHGVQFHPESVLTEGGHRLLANWLEVCGMPDPEGRSAGLSPLIRT
ncbi:aminodeoxychorismate/anthranilate synthase component II [Demequina sp. SYSU T00039]|uniref:Aminodeoxychorismate/anthranilate synthase component II n=1 Tax=Demequina lignilytica TaxID=3051663 RepID=A0AAW7M8T3_9MICO|nr:MULTISPECIES: aminodeoxychorismate/anthranilate synthase component II [unclassified Demequina]MDN4477782.1 aminodeoxychorismate/anthranilate synthase component II [Demequina sp. SYSU T00039-1]MDN4487691.1 aminodeoxychorismate/anthranilate synthase component II [Demequina sp. SYSU T00039]MDN4491402.1 aminodeoxychorismate/anthranilate synthase component II [Demequina sp. SYSU T00068]